MKYRFLPLLLLALLFVHCQQPPVILSAEYSYTNENHEGVSGYTNYIYMKSKAIGTQTEITFSNDEGDFIKMRFTTLHTGNYTLAQLVDFKMSVVSAGSGSHVVATDGFVNVTSVNGSGNSVSAFGGSFQFNIIAESENPDDVGPQGDVGTVKGVFNYSGTAVATAP